jgi:hypothetical protein
MDQKTDSGGISAGKNGAFHCVENRVNLGDEIPVLDGF